MRKQIHAQLALLGCLGACTAVEPPRHAVPCTRSSECPAAQVCDIKLERCVGVDKLGTLRADAGLDAAVVVRDAGADLVDASADLADSSRRAEPAADSGTRTTPPSSAAADGCKPEAERCDDADNDCDGRSDEALTEACGSDAGTCRPGQRSCDNGRWSACVGEVLRERERCDGLDNDCNGEVDDDPSCQLQWRRVTFSAGPSKREQAAYGYDSDRQLFVIHGGFANNMGTTDTWAFDVVTNTWRMLSDSGPSQRRDHAMAYDSVRKRFVLYGGFTGEVGLRDTWEFDGQTWTERPTEHEPPDRSLHAMVYDAARQRVVMFGGFAGGDVSAQTWEFDGVDWQERAIAGPRARRSPALTYDSEHKRVLLFGGTPEWGEGDATTEGYNDLWAYDGSSWQQLTAADPPRSRWFSSLVWHAARKVAFLYGGVHMITNLSDTHELDGTRWIDRSSAFGAPELSYSTMMIYEPLGERILSFGGVTPANEHTDAVWELR
jgi:hypothetical protein